MATGWSDIITAAMVIIDDIRWREDLAVSPAIFYRTKADWIKKALAQMNKPPELGEYLQKTMTPPAFATESWVSTQESTTQETVVATGTVGYELCSVCAYNATSMKLTPYAGAIYDKETGEITFPIQSAAGIRYTIDFYTDGTFGGNNELTVRQMDLFSTAVAIEWDRRMDRNWANLQAKVHDSSFNTPSEGPYAEKINQRLMRNIQDFNDKCSKYEQDCAYKNRFRGGQQNTILI